MKEKYGKYRVFEGFLTVGGSGVHFALTVFTDASAVVGSGRGLVRLERLGPEGVVVSG